jgi:signal transduction histidine kinase
MSKLKTLGRLGYGLTKPTLSWLGRLPPAQLVTLAFFTVTAIGILDYEAGEAVSLVAIQALPVSLVAWFVGPEIAFVLGAYSILAWVIGEWLGLPYSSIWIAVINCSLRLIFYACFVIAIARLSKLHRSLETIAQQRAVLLSREISERERLEHEMLQVAEREQVRIGQDLHDGLCQHLTGTALASQVLAQKLERQDAQTAGLALRIVDLVEEAIGLARGMAKGLHPVERRADGLMQALEEFAGNISELFHVRCRFECHTPVLIDSANVATHLFRVAQEGVSNAIKHGRADTIVITLEEAESGLRLAITDNGQGLAAGDRGGGMGLGIMADRMKMIGGKFSVGALGRGTQLVCLVPQVPAHG